MGRGLRKRLLMGVAVAAVVAAGTAAVVMAAQPAHRHHHHKGSVLASAASYLGVSQSQLKSELRSGKSLAQIANASADRSAAGLIAALESTDKQKLAAAAASLPQRITAEVDRRRGLGRSVSATAARYLGASSSEIRAQERSGKSLAQIADATAGRSEAGLIEALVATRKAALTNAVGAGTITQAQASKVLPLLPSRITARVEREPPAHPSRAHPSPAHPSPTHPSRARLSRARPTG